MAKTRKTDNLKTKSIESARLEASTAATVTGTAELIATDPENIWVWELED